MASNIMGNKVLPGVVDGNSYRPTGALWRSGSEKNYFEVVTIAGEDADEGKAVPFATIVKQTGNRIYKPITEDEIAGLTGVTLDTSGTDPELVDNTARLGIIVDESFVYGTEEAPLTANIGLRGEVDQAQLLVGDTAWDDLSDANKLALKNAFYKGGIELVSVYLA